MHDWKRHCGIVHPSEISRNGDIRNPLKNHIWFSSSFSESDSWFCPVSKRYTVVRCYPGFSAYGIFLLSHIFYSLPLYLSHLNEFGREYLFTPQSRTEFGSQRSIKVVTSVYLQNVSHWADIGSSGSLVTWICFWWLWGKEGSDGKRFVCVALKCLALYNPIICSWVHQSRHQSAGCRVS